MILAKEAVVRIAVTTLDRDGAGVGRITSNEAMSQAPVVDVHVPGALPGDDISAQIEHVSTHRPIAWARLRTVDRASPDRVPSACRAHGRCGGCVLQHFDYAAQVAWKESTLRRLVADHAFLAGVPVAPAVPSPLALGYRNKSKFVVARDEASRLVLGAYAPRSHTVVDLAGCAVAEPPLDDIATHLREILGAHAVEPYDERNLQGSLRYAVLRVNAQRQVLLTLVTATDAFPMGSAVAQGLRNRCPAVVGVVHNVNPTRGNAIYGPDERLLSGTPTIEDRIGEVRLQVSSRAFFQANRHVARAAYQEIVRAVALTGHERVVDAYAGVGGIALTLAPRAGSVIGIEEHPSAAADATASALLNGITNTRFIAGDVAQELAVLNSDGASVKAGVGADVVILNPPRKGCAPEVLQQSVALAPRVIAYLSCAPETLIRDLAVFAGLGYRTTTITPFDMLPHTPHLEALAILAR